MQLLAWSACTQVYNDRLPPVYTAVGHMYIIRRRSHTTSLCEYMCVYVRESNQTNDVAKRENHTKIPENICSVNYGSQPRKYRACSSFHYSSLLFCFLSLPLL